MSFSRIVVRNKVSSFLPQSFKRVLRKSLTKVASWHRRRKMLKAYSKFICAGDLVFDVGAHTGDITGIFLELGATVICVEPQHSCVKALNERFMDSKNVVIIQKGLGSKIGKLNLSVCEEAPTISTFSKKWKSGRFSGYKWERKLTVPITTLDSLIDKFGTPKFCKIDVEGFELEVLKGLNSKIPFISFEFTKEFLEDARLCINHVLFLGPARFNFSLGDKFQLNSRDWLDADQLLSQLKAVRDKNMWGDIYVKFES